MGPFWETVEGIKGLGQRTRHINSLKKICVVLTKTLYCYYACVFVFHQDTGDVAELYNIAREDPTYFEGHCSGKWKHVLQKWVT